MVQALPSLHGVPTTGGWLQPLAGSQMSVVQGFWSSHRVKATGRPAQVPPVQVSLAVQALWSSQPFDCGLWWQVQSGAKVSRVQGFSSVQVVVGHGRLVSGGEVSAGPVRVSWLMDVSIWAAFWPVMGVSSGVQAPETTRGQKHNRAMRTLPTNELRLPEVGAPCEQEFVGQD